MDTLKIYRTLSDVPTFAGVFPSDLLPIHPLPGLVKYMLVINTDAHTEPSSHWVAVHLDTRSLTGYYFNSYGLLPIVPAIRPFLRQACTLWSKILARYRVLPLTCADSMRVCLRSAWTGD